mmetsp:Transcript_6003/g.10338  ORF Transcript_6003/g.10338 Transcript_6003/m.10338 type:complete len:202 (+) Transcript_6003:2111-2716(+)
MRPRDLPLSFQISATSTLSESISQASTSIASVPTCGVKLGLLVPLGVGLSGGVWSSSLVTSKSFSTCVSKDCARKQASRCKVPDLDKNGLAGFNDPDSGDGICNVLSDSSTFSSISAVTSTIVLALATWRESSSFFERSAAFSERSACSSCACCRSTWSSVSLRSRKPSRRLWTSPVARPSDSMLGTRKQTHGKRAGNSNL